MSIVNSIGKTRLLNLTREAFLCFGLKDSPPGMSIYAKSEFLNPTGSIKDRIAHYMVKQAEGAKQLSTRSTLIESTSGNTGASVAMIAASKGYRSILVIPDRVSFEKQRVMKALGANVHLTPSDVTIDSPLHYVNVAKQLAETTAHGWHVNQYQSQYNVKAHYYTTGPEIWSQTKGKIDVFLTVVGSGGSLSGVGRYLKEKNPNIKVIGVDPIGSVYRHYFLYRKLPSPADISPSSVEGAGSDHLTAVIDFDAVDDILGFSDQDAFLMARRLARRTGLLLGGSSGANLWAACRLASTHPKPLRIVTLLPDSGMKYLSKFYNDSWMGEHGFSTDA